MSKDIKKFRTRLGMSQMDFSKLLGIHQTTLSRWEMGTNRVPGPAVILLDKLQKELEDDTKCS